MEDIKQQVGALIREARKAKGLTQKEVAEKLKTDEHRISRIEAGKANLTLDSLQKILEAIGSTLVLATK
ncbi:helix-turn-helix domain-containing protein [Fibrella sp. WM1]|uniref:helix-turn-helix domain-containing protein n=1 Tax=Fibrella musci TaxID=3242485 RepID=UPI0035208CA2